MDNVLESPYSVAMHQQQSQEKPRFRLEYVNGVCFVLCLMWEGNCFPLVLVEACAGDRPSTLGHCTVFQSFVVALL